MLEDFLGFLKVSLSRHNNWSIKDTFRLRWDIIYYKFENKITILLAMSTQVS